MECRDVREMADSFLGEELLTETNHEILRHLDTCPSCRTEVAARRKLRDSLRTAFERAPELQPRVDLSAQLRDRLHTVALIGERRWTIPNRWITLAAAIVLVAGLAGVITFMMTRSVESVDALARDAVGDHRNCALKYREVRTPVPLEEAAQRFDTAFRLLLRLPDDNMSTPGGPIHVVDRHSCAYGTRRFGHVVLEYRGRVVSLLLTAQDDQLSAKPLASAEPHLHGRPIEGLSVVLVGGAHHAIALVGDLDGRELTQLAHAVSVPLLQQLSGRVVAPHRTAAVFRPTAPRGLWSWQVLDDALSSAR